MLSQIPDVEKWRHHVAAAQLVKLWREDLGKINPKAAEALADPAQYSNLFPNLDLALQAEKFQVCGLAPARAILRPPLNTSLPNWNTIPLCCHATLTIAIIKEVPGKWHRRICGLGLARGCRAAAEGRRSACSSRNRGRA